MTNCDGDCADLDPARFPGAADGCNQIDDNCDGRIDEIDDLDQDGASICTGGDCDNADPTVFPGATEISDGKDNDCNCNADTNADGIVCGPGDAGVDDDTADFDDDGDCFCDLAAGVCAGSGNAICAQVLPGDCDDSQNTVSPTAIEVDEDLVDNDCNGVVDGPAEPCDAGALNPQDPFSFAQAIGLCHGEVVQAQFVGPSNTAARAIIPSFGTNNPAFEGSKMLHLSSGRADTGQHDDGTDFGATNTFSITPAALGTAIQQGCGTGEVPTTANDYTEYKLTIQVPSNAQSFSYKFQFFSTEYPTFRCDIFNDAFVAVLDSDAFQGNISFDANGNTVSVNNGFFQICFDDNTNDPPNDCTVDPNAPLAGTGYDPSGGSFSSSAGATLPLTTTAPVVPGELITLRFVIFDLGDHILDSSVLIDAFQWKADPATGGPKTIP